jgi:hypothetical protein
VEAWIEAVDDEKRLWDLLFVDDEGYQLLLMMMGAGSLESLTGRWAYQTRARGSEQG